MHNRQNSVGCVNVVACASHTYYVLISQPEQRVRVRRLTRWVIQMWIHRSMCYRRVFQHHKVFSKFAQWKKWSLEHNDSAYTHIQPRCKRVFSTPDENVFYSLKIMTWFDTFCVLNTPPALANLIPGWHFSPLSQTQSQPMTSERPHCMNYFDGIYYSVSLGP